MKQSLSFICLVLAFLATLLVTGRFLTLPLVEILSIGLVSVLLFTLTWLLTLLGAVLKRKPTVNISFSKPQKQERLKSNPNEEKIDEKRRQFLKALGSLGLGALLLSLFSKKAYGLQFGGTGVPDPIGIEPLGSSQTTGSVTLTNADTWYQVPSSNQTSRVFLVLHNRSGYDMYWTFDNSVSASTGGLLFPDGATLQLDAGTAVNVYVRCGTTGQACWYAESQSQ